MLPERFNRRRFLETSVAVSAAMMTAGAAQARTLGGPRRPYGERAAFEKSERFFETSAYPGSGSSRTPLQDLYGSITPSSLHFELHHSGVPTIDPSTHELWVHGLVDRPLKFSLADLKRLPSLSRPYFIECAGNSWMEHAGKPGKDPQRSHGLLSCSEWTGVPLRHVLEEVGVQPQARWLVAEGCDASRMNRSIPLDKAVDDVLLAYAQNGEALRPEQGYPLRLVVPGWEGNTSIKWLGRIEVVQAPAMTRDEVAFYTDLLPDGRARWFSFVMEAKSVITRPAGGQRLPGPGRHEITGMAWSGRGRIERVEVSVDGGRNWRDAELMGPVTAKAVTGFRLPWRWDGTPAQLSSRCTDDTGYVQPTREALLAARGPNATDHYNGIKTWFVKTDGTVSHE